MATNMNNKMIRIGFEAAHRYIRIATEAYYMARVQYDTIQGNNYVYSEQTRDAEEKIKDYTATCVVFSAMTNELIINDYLACYFGDKVFNKKYERLAFLQKYRAIENDIFHYKNENCFAKLQKLNNIRRQYVHSKSEDTIMAIDEYIELFKRFKDEEQDNPIVMINSEEIMDQITQAREAIETVHSLTQFIDDMDRNSMYSLRVFVPFIPQENKTGDDIIKEYVYESLGFEYKIIP